MTEKFLKMCTSSDIQNEAFFKNSQKHSLMIDWMI